MPTVTFTTLGWSNWKVPAKVTSLTVTIDGAGSGTRPGGRVTGKLAVNDTQRLYILVGQAGHLNSGATKGAGSTGGGAAGGGGHFGLAGGDGGGGGSWIRINSTTGTLKAAAGGAGGDSGDGGHGGSGGGTTGQGGTRGTGGTDSTGQSTGGTQTQGGNGGTSSSGSQFNGKNATDTALTTGGAGGEAGSSISCHGGGGGGGGYHPGGGGQASSPNNSPGGGGGGGSSYTGGLTGAANTQGGGGTGNGSVTITYTSPPPANQPPTPPTEVKINGIDAQAAMLTKATSSVKVTATLKDPDAGEKIRLLARWANNSGMSGYKQVYSDYFVEKLDSDKKRIGVAVTVSLTSLSQNTHYWVRLYAQDQHGLYSTSYTTVDFWTNKAPVADGLTINTQGEGMSLPTLSSASFAWHFTDEDTGDVQSGFKLQYRKSGTSVVAAGPWTAVEKGGSQTSWVFDPFTFKGNTFYEWQVRVKDAQGMWSAWSDLFTFHVTSTTSPPLLLTPKTFTPVEVEKVRRFTWKFVDPDAGDKQAKADFRYRAIGRTQELTVGGITGANLDATNFAENPTLETGITTGWNSVDAAKYQLTNSVSAPLSGLRSLVSKRLGQQVVDATNLSANPNLEGGVATDWLTNDPAKYVVTASSASPINGTQSILSTRSAVPVTDATNLATNPNLEGGSLTGWNAVSGTAYPVTLDTTAPISGTSSALTTRASTLDATCSALALSGQAVAYAPVAAGATITFTTDVKVELAGRRIRAFIQYFDGVATTSSGTTVTLVASTVAGAVNRINLSGVVPAGMNSARLRIIVDLTAGTATLGERVWYDNCRVSVGTTATATEAIYFDGSTPPGWTHRWTGTAHASTSEQVSTGTGTPVIATNLSVNPIADTADNVAWWEFNRVTTALGSGYLRATITDALVGSLNQRIYSASSFTNPLRIAVAPGETVRVSCQVRSSAAFPMSQQIQFRDAAGAVLAATASVGVTSNASTWTNLTDFSAVAPANTNFVVVHVGISGTGARNIGDTFDVRHVLISKGSTVGSYFDGTSAAVTTDYTYRWTGATNASSSERVVSTDNTAMSVYLGGAGFPCTPGVALNGSLDTRHEKANRKITGYWVWLNAAGGVISSSTRTTLVADTGAANTVKRVMVTATPVAGTAKAWLIIESATLTGVAVVGERVWLDRLTVSTNGNTGYFDGSTPPAGSYTYRWTGAVNASTSQRLAPGADTIAAALFMTKNSGAFFDATPGQVMAYGVDVKVSQTSRRARGYITWRNAAGTILSSTPNTLLNVVKGTTARVIVSGTAPANAATGAPVIQIEATSGNALVGETVQFDRLRVGADGTYFDGSTPPAGLLTYKWLGTVNASASQRYKNTGVNPPPTEWVTLFGLVAPGVPGANQFWDIEANTFTEAYTYEWQVRTYDSPGAVPSEWADSFYFYGINTPGALSGPLPFGGTTYAQGSLGCGSYRVFVYQQGGQIRLGELEPLDHMTFTRLRDDISSCNAFTSGYSTDCGAFYSTLRCWMHELVVFRDGVRVWEGPITRIGFTSTSVEIEAKDVMAYTYRRIMRQGYNDAYRLISQGTNGQPNQYLGLLSAVKRASMLITEGLAPYDPNVLPYLTTIEYPDDALESRVVEDWSRTIWEEVDDLAATAGIDYTTVGRRIIIWDTHRAIGRLPEMRDGDFSDSPIVTEYGMQLATFFAVTNGSGVVGWTGGSGKTQPYGPIEMLASSYSDASAASGEIQTPEALKKATDALVEQAKRNMSSRWPAPLIVRIPDNTTLSPKANVGFQQLIPGVWLPLRSVNTPRQVVQWQKLDSVSVEYDEKGEKVHVVMSPAPNGGNDPDSDAAAEADD